VRGKFIYVFVISVVFGSLFFSLFKIEQAFLLFLLTSLLFLIISLKWKSLLFVSLFFLFSGLTILRGEIIFNEPTIPNYLDQKINITGEIIREPDIRETSTRLIVKVDFIETGKGKIFTNENIILITQKYPEYQIKEKISAYGKIQTPENFKNENDIEFDYKSFLAKDKIYSLIYYAGVEKIINPNNPTKFSIQQKIFSIKKQFLGNIQKVIPSPEAELLGGILLGAKRSLGKDLEEDFRKTGLIHIVVLSGYNITIIADAIFRFLAFLPFMFQNILGVVSIVIFAIMVGSGPTVIRSTIMAILAILSRTSHRTYNVNRALFFAGAIMIFHNPMILLYDPSFQLSFLATIGLIHLSDKVSKVLFFIPERFGLKEISSATLSTQIAVLPLLVTMTGEISIVSPIVNLLTLQIIPLTMLVGFISGLLVFINHNVGLFFAIIPYLFLNYILKIVGFFAELDFAVFIF